MDINEMTIVGMKQTHNVESLDLEVKGLVCL